MLRSIHKSKGKWFMKQAARFHLVKPSNLLANKPLKFWFSISHLLLVSENKLDTLLPSHNIQSKKLLEFNSNWNILKMVWSHSKNAPLSKSGLKKQKFQSENNRSQQRKKQMIKIKRKEPLKNKNQLKNLQNRNSRSKRVKNKDSLRLNINQILLIIWTSKNSTIYLLSKVQWLIKIALF